VLIGCKYFIQTLFLNRFRVDVPQIPGKHFCKVGSVEQVANNAPEIRTHSQSEVQSQKYEVYILH